MIDFLEPQNFILGSEKIHEVELNLHFSQFKSNEKVSLIIERVN